MKTIFFLLNVCCFSNVLFGQEISRETAIKYHIKKVKIIELPDSLSSVLEFSSNGLLQREINPSNIIFSKNSYSEKIYFYEDTLLTKVIETQKTKDSIFSIDTTHYEYNSLNLLVNRWKIRKDYTEDFDLTNYYYIYMPKSSAKGDWQKRFYSTTTPSYIKNPSTYLFHGRKLYLTNYNIEHGYTIENPFLISHFKECYNQTIDSVENFCMTSTEHKMDLQDSLRYTIVTDTHYGIAFEKINEGNYNDTWKETNHPENIINSISSEKIKSGKTEQQLFKSFSLKPPYLLKVNNIFNKKGLLIEAKMEKIFEPVYPRKEQIIKYRFLYFYEYW